MPQRRGRGLLAAAIAVGLAASCGGDGGGDANGQAAPPPAPRSDVAAAPVADIPAVPSPIVSSPHLPRLKTVNSEALDGRFDFGVYGDTEGCGDCHEDILDEWSGSAHAHSSMNNPVYRRSFESFEAAMGADNAAACGGCHDPALLLSGTLADKGSRDKDPRAKAGVTCAMCHGLTAPNPIGNGSWTLSTGAVPEPDGDGDNGLQAHKDRLTPKALGSVQMCASCHQATLGDHSGHPHALGGLGEPSSWAHSVYAGPSLDRIDDDLPEQTCVDCHMPKVAKDPDIPTGLKRRSHAFLGGHTVLAQGRGPKALAAVVASMRAAVRLDIAAIRRRTAQRVTLPAERAVITAGDAFDVDVIIVNEGVGHRFPGGARDMKDVWVELEVRDAQGALVAEAGTQHEETGADPTAHRLRTLMSDAEGRIVTAHAVERFRTLVADHTVGPRDAALVRYSVEIPEGVGAERLPLTLRARLRHRRYTLEMTRQACGETATRCPKVPVVDLAEVSLALGQPAADPTAGPLWRRLHDHGLALLHGVQEHLDEARPSLDKALALLPEGPPRSRAMVLSLLARLDVLTHRVDEALAGLDQVAALVPGHVAVAYLKGEVYANVWRWPEAARAYAEAARLRPNAPNVWDRLAAAQGSVGDDAASLRSARRGLKLRGTHEGLLRSQYLALERLGGTKSKLAAAKAAWLRFRADDDSPDHRSRCIEHSPLCRLEREPIHVHRTRPARQALSPTP